MATGNQIPADAKRIAEAVTFEKAVLGLAMSDSDACRRVVLELFVEDFYLPQHRSIFNAVLTQACRGHPVDFVTIFDRVKTEPFQTFLDMEQFTVTPVGHAIHMIREASDRRKAQGLLQSTLDELGYDDDLVGQFRGMSDEMVKIIANQNRNDFRTLGEQFKSRPIVSPTPLWVARSGLTSVDYVMGGFIPTRLYVIAGRTSMGKTAYGQNLFLHAVRSKVPALWVSIEGDNEQLHQRLLAIDSGVDVSSITMGECDFDQTERLEKSKLRLEALPIMALDGESQWSRIKAAVTQKKFRDPDLSMVFFDHLGAIKMPSYKKRYEVAPEILAEMYELGRQLKLVTVLVVQISRETEKRKDHRPSLGDLRESGTVEEIADVVMLLYRPWYYDKKADPEQCTIGFAKQRNGPTGSFSLKFHGHNLTFENP